MTSDKMYDCRYNKMACMLSHLLTLTIPNLVYPNPLF